MPLVRAFPYGLQHVLAMFVANLAPIAIIVAAGGAVPRTCGLRSSKTPCSSPASARSSSCSRCGAWAAGLPIVMGISFTFVTVAVHAWRLPMATGRLIGAVIVGGVIEGVLGLFAQYWRRIITPIVAAVVVTSIGFSLLGVGAASLRRRQRRGGFRRRSTNLLLGTVSLVACLVFQVTRQGHDQAAFGAVRACRGVRWWRFLWARVDFSGFAGLQLVRPAGSCMPVTPRVQRWAPSCPSRSSSWCRPPRPSATRSALTAWWACAATSANGAVRRRRRPTAS